MIILRSPKGWTGPKELDGKPVEGTFRAHQVPLADVIARPDELHMLEDMDAQLSSRRAVRSNAASCITSMPRSRPRASGAWARIRTPTAGCCCRDLALPDFCDYAVDVPKPGVIVAEAARVMGAFLRDVMKLNTASKNFRVVSPDETASNRWNARLRSDQSRIDRRDHSHRRPCRARRPRHGSPQRAHVPGLARRLSAHRAPRLFLSCYEAFVHIVDSMFNQHAKWLKVTREIPWRRPIASLNYLLSSHVWRQDHNGFSHQDPGFIDHVVNKKGEIVRVYLPPDANTLLSVTDHCLRSRNYVNVIVAGKQPALQWLTMDEAIRHCTLGLGIWEFASNDGGAEPDVVMACAGDIPTLETLAAVDWLRHRIPDLKIRVVNVVDLMTLQPASEHPHGISDKDYDSLFTTRQADHLQLSRLSLADSPARLPPRQSESARARLQRGRHHHHAVRYVRAQRDRPLQSGHRRDRPRAAPGRHFRRASARNYSIN